MIWVFGYGSLIFRPGFPFIDRAPATILGYERRLDQGSPDHRGTPERLGRVATLVPRDGARCGGVAYAIAPEVSDDVLAALDHREQGGYDRVELAAELGGRGATVNAITWIANHENRYHLGATTLEAMIAQILGAVGPSGTNVEYVLRLDEALRGLGLDDPHVRKVAEALRAGPALDLAAM